MLLEYDNRNVLKGKKWVIVLIFELSAFDLDFLLNSRADNLQNLQ
jgi:hypothetical protein